MHAVFSNVILPRTKRVHLERGAFDSSLSVADERFTSFLLQASLNAMTPRRIRSKRFIRHHGIATPLLDCQIRKEFTLYTYIR